MIVDKDLCLMTDTAVTASAGTTDYFAPGAVQNVLDEQWYLQALCTTTCDSANDTATVTLQAQVDDNTSFSSARVLAQSAAFAIGSAELTAGGRILVPIPFNDVAAEKYLRGYFSVGTQDLNAGKFTVDIVKNPPFGL